MIQKQNEDQSQLRKYFHQEINPLFHRLALDLAKDRPQNVTHYSMNWFKKQAKGSIRATDTDTQSDQNENQEIPQSQFKILRWQKIVSSAGKRREGVSCQVAGPFNKRREVSLSKGTRKQESLQMQILFVFSICFLFKDMDDEQKKILIDNMAAEVFQQGQTVITQGQFNDKMFFVNEGQFESSKLNSIGDSRIVQRFNPGSIFQELALLHRSRTVTTIVCNSAQGKLYSLQREVYSDMRKLSRVKRRNLYINTLKKVQFFGAYKNDEIQKLCDVLIEIHYDAGKYVICQGDIGDKFFMVMEGILVAIKGREKTVIQCYKQGDSFGEPSLVNDIPRQASVKAITKCKLLYITLNVFSKLLCDPRLASKLYEHLPKSKGSRLGSRHQDK